MVRFDVAGAGECCCCSADAVGGRTAELDDAPLPPPSAFVAVGCAANASLYALRHFACVSLAEASFGSFVEIFLFR